MERIKEFGAGLRVLGMEPQPDPAACPKFEDAKGNNIFIIYENTCADWLTAAQVRSRLRAEPRSSPFRAPGENQQ